MTEATSPPYANWNWRDAPVEPGNIILVDVDGVISDGTHRQHFLQQAKKDWTSFFEHCDKDDPLVHQMAMINAFDPTLPIVLLTARPHHLRDKSLEWLSRQNMRWDALILRDKRDGTLRSPQFKQRSVRQLRKQGYEPIVSFDDDQRNVAMFHAEDVPCVYIHSGYYEA